MQKYNVLHFFFRLDWDKEFCHLFPVMANCHGKDILSTLHSAKLSFVGNLEIFEPSDAFLGCAQMRTLRVLSVRAFQGLQQEHRG